MTKRDLLKKAEYAVMHKKYDQALKLLEPKIPLFTDDSNFFYLLGQACYAKGDLSGTEIYLKRGLVIDHDSIPLRQLLAVAALRRRDTALSVRLWLEILDFDPDNKSAQAALNELKNISTSADLARFIISPSMARLVPPLKTSLIGQGLLFIFIGAVIIYLIIIVMGKISEIDDLPKRSSTRNTYEIITDDGYITTQGDFTYNLTIKEINTIMKKASDYFYKNQDNLALRELNRIKNSDASVEIKNRALNWRGALSTPTFANLDHNFSYRDVASEPYLYEDCYVIWRGMINNLVINSDNISFNLFVGYQDKRVLEGEVAVVLNFETSIEPSLTTEVLGRIKTGSNGQFHLEATSIHQIIR